MNQKPGLLAKGPGFFVCKRHIYLNNYGNILIFNNFVIIEENTYIKGEKD
ncbi:hypothetical protein GA0061096_3000 [Fictibacillus enclensis]|nr:hypothetical protein GA0061096_3000 [Fictibacillus enclensis]